MKMEEVGLTTLDISWKTWQNGGVGWALILWVADTFPMLLNHATVESCWSYSESTKSYKYCKSLRFLKPILYSVSRKIPHLLKAFNHLLLLTFAFSP